MALDGNQSESEWQLLTRRAQMRWVQAHKGQCVRYVKRSELQRGRAVFGLEFPPPWRTTKLYGLIMDDAGKPCLSVQGPVKLFGVDTLYEPWDELWDVQEMPGDAQSAEGRLEAVEAENFVLRRQIEMLEARIAELEGAKERA